MNPATLQSIRVTPKGRIHQREMTRAPLEPTLCGRVPPPRPETVFDDGVMCKTCKKIAER